MKLLMDGRVIANPRETPILKPRHSSESSGFFYVYIFLNLYSVSTLAGRVIANPRETPILKPSFARIRVFLCPYFSKSLFSFYIGCDSNRESSRDADFKNLAFVRIVDGFNAQFFDRKPNIVTTHRWIFNPAYRTSFKYLIILGRLLILQSNYEGITAKVQLILRAYDFNWAIVLI